MYTQQSDFLIDVACAIIEQRNKVLVAQRGLFMDMPMKWEFPGGKVRKNESAQRCIIREIKEELGIEIAIKKHLAPSTYKYDRKQVRLIPFVCSIVSGSIQLFEHRQVVWMHKDNLWQLDWCAADIEVLKEYFKVCNQ